MIIGTTGAVVGEISEIWVHPNAEKIWLSRVRVGEGQDTVQIVFGGIRMLYPGDLVPVALPGTRVIVQGREKPKKMRNRAYRGERSHGMLCSLRELGWVETCVDEVAVLRDLQRGQLLDDIDVRDRPRYVANWSETPALVSV